MKDEKKGKATEEVQTEDGIKLTDEQMKGVSGGLVRTPEPEETEEAVGEDLPTRNARIC